MSNHRNVFENNSEDEPSKNIGLIVHELSRRDLAELDEEEMYFKLKEAGFNLSKPITVREDPGTGSRTFVQTKT